LGAYGRAPTIGAIPKSLYTPAYQRLLALLREARRETGLSQRALAKRLGQHPSWVAKVEIGERRLDVVEFLRVCRALKRDPAAILKRVSSAL